MAENGNRGPNDFRTRNVRKRREPPIIDASATEVPLDPTAADDATVPAKDVDVNDTQAREDRPAEVDAAAASAPHDAPLSTGPDLSRDAGEPVLFGSALRDPAAKTDAAPAADAAPVVDAAEPSGSAFAAEPVSSATGEPVARSGSSGGAVPPAASAAPRVGGGAAPWLLTVSTLALLGALAWVLYTEPQRSGAAQIAELRTKVAALEARPDPAQVQGQVQGTVATLDKRLTAADADRANLAKAVAGLNARLDAVSQQAQSARADAATPAAPPPTGTAAVATVGALAALAGKLEGLDTRVAAVSAAQNQTARSVADLPKPVAPDFGPVDAKVAALAAQVGTLDGKVNGSDARLNAFDAKVNGVDGKINGFDARMNAFENRTNGLDAKLADAAGGLGRIQATVANLPRTDLGPLQASTAALDGKVAKIEGQLASPKDGARVTEARAVGSADETRAAPIALVGQAVARAIADGRPYASDLDALKALGAEPDALAKLSPLSAKGAPTVAALRQQWSAEQGDVLAAVKPADSGNALDRFAASARALVQVRRVGAVQGDDPSALVSQIEAALATGDVPGALAAWDGLPRAGKDRSQDWAAAAHARVEAAGAAQGIVGRAIATLGRTKS